MTIDDMLRRDLRAQLAPIWDGTDAELEEKVEQLIADAHDLAQQLRNWR